MTAFPSAAGVLALAVSPVSFATVHGFGGGGVDITIDHVFLRRGSRRVRLFSSSNERGLNESKLDFDRKRVRVPLSRRERQRFGSSPLVAVRRSTAVRAQRTFAPAGARVWFPDSRASSSLARRILSSRSARHNSTRATRRDDAARRHRRIRVDARRCAPNDGVRPRAASRDDVGDVRARETRGVGTRVDWCPRAGDASDVGNGRCARGRRRRSGKKTESERWAGDGDDDGG